MVIRLSLDLVKQVKRCLQLFISCNIVEDWWCTNCMWQDKEPWSAQHDAHGLLIHVQV